MTLQCVFAQILADSRSRRRSEGGRAVYRGTRPARPNRLDAEFRRRVAGQGWKPIRRGLQREPSGTRSRPSFPRKRESGQAGSILIRNRPCTPLATPLQGLFMGDSGGFFGGIFHLSFPPAWPADRQTGLRATHWQASPLIPPRRRRVSKASRERRNVAAAVLDEAERAGGTIVKPAQDLFWGGHSGYFKDPDGHFWEVAWNPFSPLDDDGNLPGSR